MKTQITRGDCCMSANKPCLQHVTQKTARILAIFISLVFFSGIFGGQVFAAPSEPDPIPGFTGPAPDNAFSFDLEGCNLDKITEGTYDPTATPPVLYCDTSSTTWPATDDSYTDGNLGKQWEELDLVPHRFLSDSNGLVDDFQTFQIVLGADNLINDGLGTKPLAIGYDRIAKVEFRGDLSTGNSLDCQLTLIGGNSTGDFGIGGAIEEIVQVVEIRQTKDNTCVWDYVERLAITSSNISGSSNRSYVVSGTGAQSVPIPSDIQPQELSKLMSAVEDSSINWTIQKSADPVTFDFANTCKAENPNTKDVTVTVEFTKGETDPSSLTVTSMVTAVNPSSRNVTYDCTDVLYGVLPDAVSESELDTQGIIEVVAPGMETFDLTHIVDPGSRQLRNELTCTLEVADILNLGDFIVVGTLDAAFSLPDSDIADGDVVNSDVVITDVEKIIGTGFTFSAVQVATGVIGGFTGGYAPGNSTTGPITWVSDSQGDSGSIQFTKTVTVARFIETTGTLSDTATLPLTGTTDVEHSASTTFSAGALVELTIVKNIPDVLRGSDSIACHFTVMNSSGEIVNSPVFNFSAGGLLQQSMTITDLPPDSYTVTEGACGGLVPSGGSTQNADLTLDINSTFADCSETKTFVNIVGAGSAVAEVNKVTIPVGDEDSWEMALKGPGAGTDGRVLFTSDGDPVDFERFTDALGNDFFLEVGSYTITEVLLDGWEQTATSGDCEFDISIADQFSGVIKQCTITNKKLGTIIINKLTVPVELEDATNFDYTDDIELPNSFMLSHGGTKTFNDVQMGNYSVTEGVPTPEYDLIRLVCVEDETENSTVDIDTGEAMIMLEPGETVECTYTNRKRAMAQVIKTESGTTPVNTFDFELRVGASTSSSGTTFATGSTGSTGVVEFGCNGSEPELCTNDTDGNANIVPGNYQLCEVGMMPGWSNDIDGFTPDSLPDGGDNSVECINITLNPGDVYSLDVDNTPPSGGDARTIGFWKNWTSCDGHGNQDPILEENLPVTLDTDFVISTCPVAVDLLDKRKVGDDVGIVRDGKKSASDPIYNMVAQLVAAKLNLNAGADPCGISATISAADELLTIVGFTGNLDYKKGPAKLTKGKKYLANTLAGTLDDYNNNELACP